VLEYAGRCGVVALGPGLGVGPSQRRLVEALLGQDRPLVIDADGLNNLAAVEDWPNRRRCELVLTPHPGEFSRLTGVATADVQARRAELATAHARKWAAAGHRPSGTADRDHPLVLVLKGAGTVVTDGARIYTNDTGNPGMATGGTGDVLTGLVAGLLAQVAAHKLSAMQAAMLAVWSHGRAGDLAAAELGETSLIATDLLEYLPKALCERGG
jgi:NAD(P)H-hydrate epimerase